MKECTWYTYKVVLKGIFIASDSVRKEENTKINVLNNSLKKLEKVSRLKPKNVEKTV